MTREELIEALRREEPLFRERKVRHVSLFGSRARGDHRPDSDVDLLIEYEPEPFVGLFPHIRLETDLTERLGREVHLLRKPIKRDRLRADVEADAILVF